MQDDKKINNMVTEVYVYTINSKNRVDQELKSEDQGHKIYIFNKEISSNLYFPTKGYFRETYKS